jgi:hypothetical protein
MENEDKKPKEVDIVSNTDIYAEYDYIGGIIMAERPKKTKETNDTNHIINNTQSK